MLRRYQIMKKLNKKISAFIHISYISISLILINPNTVHAESVIPFKSIPSVTNVQSTQLVVTPDSDITGWRYKSENSKVYRRQYNYTKQKWIGEWELC
jgi:hypothetical protein